MSAYRGRATLDSDPPLSMGQFILAALLFLVLAFQWGNS